MRALQSPETAPSSLIRPVAAWVAVAAALGVALLGAGLRLVLVDLLGDRGAFLVFVPAVVAGAALGGWRVGLVATLLSLLTEFVLSPAFQALLIEAALFCSVAATVTVGGEWFQRAHRDLSARETHLRLILNTVPEAMILIDEKGIMRAFSPTAERLFGWSVDQAVGQNVSILMPDPHRAARRISQTLLPNGRTSHHRPWSDCDGNAKRQDNLSNGTWPSRCVSQHLHPQSPKCCLGR